MTSVGGTCQPVFCNRRTQIFYLTSCPCVFVMQTWRYQTVWSYLPVSKGATRRASANSFVNLKTFWALVSPPWSPTGFHFQTGEHQQHLCRITRFGFAQWGVSLRGFCFCRLAIRKGGGTLSGVFLHIVTFWLRDNEAVPPQSPPTRIPVFTSSHLGPRRSVSRIFEIILHW